VTANLALAVLTRVSVVYRFRKDVDRRRTALLILGSVPGLYAGTRILTGVDRSLIRLATGLIVMLVTLLLARSLARSPAAPPPPRVPGAGRPLAAAVAGFLGGVLGTTTSLSGVPPVLLLARERAAARSFQADLATYFVVANTIALALLSARGALAREALFPAAALWLPGALLGNFAGVALGTRLPERAFRWLTLAIAFTAGAVTAVTA